MNKIKIDLATLKALSELCPNTTVLDLIKFIQGEK